MRKFSEAGDVLVADQAEPVTIKMLCTELLLSCKPNALKGSPGQRRLLGADDVAWCHEAISGPDDLGLRSQVPIKLIMSSRAETIPTQTAIGHLLRYELREVAPGITDEVVVDVERRLAGLKTIWDDGEARSATLGPWIEMALGREPEDTYGGASFDVTVAVRNSILEDWHSGIRPDAARFIPSPSLLRSITTRAAYLIEESLQQVSAHAEAVTNFRNANSEPPEPIAIDSACPCGSGSGLTIAITFETQGSARRSGCAAELVLHTSFGLSGIGG